MQVITPDMLAFMKDLRSKVTVGLVGGSDYAKICEQMEGDETIKSFEYVFAENGLVAYKGGELVGKEVIHQTHKTLCLFPVALQKCNAMPFFSP